MLDTDVVVAQLSGLGLRLSDDRSCCSGEALKQAASIPLCRRTRKPTMAKP